MSDTTIKKVNTHHAPTGTMGQKYLVSGVHVGMRFWDAEPAGEPKSPLQREYETVGYAIKGRVELHLGHRVKRFAKPAGVPDARAIQFDHVSLNLPTEDALLALRQRLLNHRCEVTDVVDHGLMQSIYFTDPHGIALEASWWVHAPTGYAPEPDDPRYANPNPVPAAWPLVSP